METKYTEEEFQKDLGRLNSASRKRDGWEKLSYMLLGMCLMGALWAATSLKYC